MADGTEIGAKQWEALNRIAAHEAMCEERSKTIFNRLERIEDSLDGINKRVFGVGVLIISGMTGLIITLLLK